MTVDRFVPSKEMVRSAEELLGPETSAKIRSDTRAVMATFGQAPARYEGPDKCSACNGYKGHFGYKGMPSEYGFQTCRYCGGTGQATPPMND